MLGPQKAKQLCQEVLRRVGEGIAEVSLLVNDESLTRFANNAIHQNVAENDIHISVQVFIGSREGTAATNRLDPEALDMVVERARANAKVSPENPDFPGLAGPASYSLVQSFDEVTAEYSPMERARLVKQVCALASAKDFNAFGAFTTGVTEIVLANTNGMYAYHMTTRADFQTVAMEKDGDASGWSQASGWQVAEIPASALGEQAIHKTEIGRSPRLIEPGEYPVILDPYATQDLLLMLNLTGMGANAVQEGRSWMNNRIDTQVFSPNISIWDDALDPNGIPIPFDFEGTPKQRVDIVKDGRVIGPVYDRTTARKDGRESTGHGLPRDARGYSPLATNLFMAPGDVSLDDMIASTNCGLYITRFHYTRPVHPADCTITGMTRDGAYWIENGEIQYPVKNLRFTQSYIQALAGVDAIGKDTHLLNAMGIVATRVPALKLKSFNFTSSTV
jgi:predicted Zn-dependent protease